jgi:Flp pilus assembly protein TadD
MMKKLIVISFMLAAAAAASWGQTDGAEALGDSCVEAHDTFHALQYYGEAMAADSSAALQRKVARCHYMRGDYRRCIDTMMPVAGPGGDSLTLEQMRYMFECYKMLADNDGQMTWGRAILRRCPMDGEMTAAVAAIYNTDDRYLPSSASSLTNSFLEKDSTCIPVLRQNADAKFLMQSFDAAITVYNKLLALGDSSYNVVYSLGMSYMQVKEDSLARKWLLRAAEMKDMKDAGCLYRLGMVCIELDSLAEGIEYLDLAYSLMQPDGRVVYIVKRALGEGYYKQGDYWNAIYAWTEALRRNRNSMATIFNVAQTYGLVGQHDKEKQFYRSFLSMAALVERTPALDEMVKQAEAVVGEKEDFKGVIIGLPVD